MSFRLSLKNGTRLALIKGGKHDGKVLYLLNKNYVCCDKCKKKDCKKKCCENCCMVHYFKGTEDEKDFDNLKLDDGKFQQAPTNIEGNTDCLFISGKAGAGKSRYMKKFLDSYKHFFKENQVFLFSESPKDKALDDIVKRIPLDDFSQSDLTWEDFGENCAVCFDDIDVLENTKENGYLRKKLYSLMNALIQNARKQHIAVIQTAHIATDGQTTKHILNGCTSFIFFPASVSKQQKRALKDYIGLGQNIIKKLLKMKDEEWICIYTTFPLICLTPKKAFIIDTSEDD